MPSDMETRPGHFPAAGYFLATVPALLNLLFVTTHPWGPAIFSFVVIPLLEWIAGLHRSWAVPKESIPARRKKLIDLPGFRAVLLVHAAVSLVSLLRTLVYVSTNPSALNLARIVSGTCIGVSNLVAGHEAGHKIGEYAALERFVGSLLISSALNPAFRGDHPRHHKHVGLPHDASTAPMGMSPYFFALRAEFWGWHQSISETWTRYERSKKLPLLGGGTDHFVNCVLFSLGMLFLEFVLLGWPAVRAHCIIGVCSTLLFDTAVLFQEHTGLSRRPGEPITAAISWDSSNPVTNLFGWDEGRHSDHHLAPTVPYSELENMQEAPELPFGLVTMGIIATTCPPFFWRLVRKGQREYKQRDRYDGKEYVEKNISRAAGT